MSKGDNFFYPDEIAKNPKEIGGISRAVTHSTLDLEDRKLSINFEFYNSESCEILNKKHRAEYGKSLFRKVLKTFINVCNVKFLDLGLANIRMDSISKDKKYSDLFRSLPEGVSLLHNNIGKKERLFYFYDPTYFYPIAITVKHR